MSTSWGGGPSLIGAALTDEERCLGIYALTQSGTFRREGAHWVKTSPATISGSRLVEIDESKLPLFDQLQAIGAPVTLELIAAMSTSGSPASWDTQENFRHFDGAVKRHPGPAVWESKVRGLMLGLALGDALGRAPAVIPRAGLLHAGATTQLAAWTAEGMLRRCTRYGLYPAEGRWDLIEPIAVSARRWVSARGIGGSPPRGSSDDHPSWLTHVQAMKEDRGRSPSIEGAVATHVPSDALSCRPMIKGLPLAAYAGAEPFIRSSASQAADLGARVARATHRHEAVLSTAGAAVCLAVNCLREPSSFSSAAHAALSELSDPLTRRIVARSLEASAIGWHSDVLRDLAPDDTPTSVLAGAVYVAGCHPEWESTNTALRLARSAPDGDGVAALVGALLGAVHGYEVFPTGLVSRLELGWVMDRLAIDLAKEVKEEQVPQGGWKEGGGPWLEPWWDAKYPGA